MGTYETFDEQKQFACRVIADHARTTAFAIADGILPGNEGRNYVLRKIMRRAIYHGREHLGFEDSFFYKVCDFVVEQMKDAYPELETQREFIGKMVRLEEERFGNTLTVGLKKFEEDLDKNISISKSLLEIFKKTLLETNSVEKAKEKKTECHKQEFPHRADYNLAALIVKNRIPLYLAKWIMCNLPEQTIEDAEPIIRYDLQSVRSDSEEIQIDFDEYYARTILNYIDKQGNPEDKEFVKSFILNNIGKVVSENMFGEIILVNNLAEKFLHNLDIYFSGDNSDFLDFRDFARNYDTYGTPKDLIKISLEDKGYMFNEEEFNEKFDKALSEIQSSGEIGKTKQNEKINPIYKSLEEDSIRSNFHGYDLTKVENAKVISIVKNDEKVDELNEGEEGLIILDETPFYAESGGQVGDRGTIVSRQSETTSNEQRTTNNFATANVFDTFAPIAGIVLHKSKIKSGSIKVGDKVTAIVDAEKRDATRRNHTATHLVHAALKEVLGTHVKQAGSVVAPNYLRFDFTHYQPMTEQEIKDVEDLVNKYILENHSVNTNVMPIDEAKKSGAVALFGEKYGSEVRVLSVADGVFSKELCGGTHVSATGDIGSFKITNDEAIASGVRRIRAITGFDAFERFREDEILIDKSLEALKTQRDQLPTAIEKLQEELKRTRKEVDELKLKIASGAIGSASNADETKEIGGVKVIAKAVDDLDKGGMRHLSDNLMSKIKSGVVIIGNKTDEKVSFIVRVSDDLTDKIRAGNIIKEIAPIVGGRGGGKPDMAEGGGTETEKLSEAIDASYKVIEKMLG